jgi:hypothetical protein
MINNKNHPLTFRQEELCEPYVITPEFRKLYPGKSDSWLKEAEQNVDKYIAEVIRIYDDIYADPIKLQEFRAILNQTKRWTDTHPSRQSLDCSDTCQKPGPATGVVSQWTAMSLEKDPAGLLCK